MAHDEMIAVIQAHKDGIQIQSRRKNGEKFADVNCPSWNFLDNEYRIKPEPMDIWVLFGPDGLCAAASKTDLSTTFKGKDVRKFREVLDE